MANESKEKKSMLPPVQTITGDFSKNTFQGGSYKAPIMPAKPKKKTLPEVGTASMIENIKRAIEAFIDPSTLSMMLGVFEDEMKKEILSSPEKTNEVREHIFSVMVEANAMAYNTPSHAKPDLDFISDVVTPKLERWNYFITSAYNKSPDFLLYYNALRGGLAANDDFFKGATDQTIGMLRKALVDIECFAYFYYSRIKGVPFVKKKHAIAMFKEFKYCLENKNVILVINIAPRAGKSTLATMFAMYTLMYYGNSNLLFTSFGEGVLTKTEKDVVSVFKDAAFLRVFNKHKVKGYGREADFMTDDNSSFFSVTFKGGVTGRGGTIFADDEASESAKGKNILFIDDPNNPQDLGTARMETAGEVYDNTWCSRIGLGNQVVVMQRLARNDLTGHILEKYKNVEGKEVRILTMPFEYTQEVEDYFQEQKATYPMYHWVEISDYLSIGELLIDKQVYDSIKSSVLDHVYKTQYLQIPTNETGMMFSPNDFYNRVKKVGVACRGTAATSFAFMEVSRMERVDGKITEVASYDVEGIYCIHIDPANTKQEDSKAGNPDETVVTLGVLGFKNSRENKDMAGVISQFSGKWAYESVKTLLLDLIDSVRETHLKDAANKFDKRLPIIYVVIEGNGIGNSLGSYIKGSKLQGVLLEVLSRTNQGSKDARFSKASFYYKEKLFWDADSRYDMSDLMLKYTDKSWFKKVMNQHLMYTGEDEVAHDDRLEAPADFCNLWLASDGRDTLYQKYIKARQ